MTDIKELLHQAALNGASDVFLTSGKIPSVRQHGEILPLDMPPMQEQEIEAFRKTLLTPPEERVYQEKSAYDASCVLDSSSRLRINFFTSLHGPGLVARPIFSGRDLHFETLGLPKIFEQICREPRGIIFICGSTGSGKSTTMGAMLNYINRNFRKHILTIEDPIEYIYEDDQSLVTQREINAERGGFLEAFRAAMRENPDIIVVGEMRDMETMSVALSAALTGHLVISTIHTNDTISAMERVLSLFPDTERDQAAADLGIAVSAIIAQRLLPSKLEGGGMVPALEILLGTPSVKKFIGEQDYAGLEEILKAGGDLGMITFVRSIYRLYEEGIITLEAAEHAVTNKDELNLLIKGMESGVDAFRNNYGDSEGSKNLVDMRTLFRSSIKNKASDLVLSVGAAPSLRLNGELQELDLPVLTPNDVQRLLFSVINQRQRVELETNRELDLALSISMPSDTNPDENETVRFRVNAFYQRGTIGVVARTIATTIPRPEELNLPEVFMRLIEKRQGLILVTGPTGSGKSTTLASLINHINRTRNAHIITIEDPIEYVHTNVNSIIEQRELHADTKSFSTALKYSLRQNPDVIMVGEMRDVETIASALTAAETGHLVFGTIHTNSAPQTIDRIVDSFPTGQQNQIRQQLSAVILGVLSQRLLRKVSGSGRVAAFEVLVGTPPVQALVREGKTHQLQSAIETGYKDGMITLEKSLETLYDQGMISYEDTKAFSCDYKPTEAF